MNQTKFLFLTILISLIMASLSFSHQESPFFPDLKLPSEIEKVTDNQTSRIIFLYGIVCVGGCPIGDYIYSIKDREDIIFIVPPEFTDDDMANLRRGMSVKGKIYKASEKNAAFLKAIARLKKIEDWEKNVVLELKEKKIMKIELH